MTKKGIFHTGLLLKKPMGKEVNIIKYGIREKLILSFLIPVIFVLILGISSYSKSSKGFISNYEQSSKSNIDMTAKYLEYGLNTIEETAFQYTMDKNFTNYISGYYIEDIMETIKINDSINTDLLVKSQLDEFIENIYIIPKNSVNMISSNKKSLKGFYDELLETDEGEMLKEKRVKSYYIGNHFYLDSTLGINTANYAFSLFQSFDTKQGCIIIDVDRKTINSILSNLNLGILSKVAIITPDGKELSVNRDKHGEVLETTNGDFQFSTLDFVKDSIASKEQSQSQYVNYKSEDYLYLYNKIGNSGIIITAIIPKSTIMAQANDIKMNTVILVILSCIVAITIGTLMSVSIGKETQNITKQLKKISKGNLTVDIATKRKDEFGIIAQTVKEMTDNIRSLIQKVTDVCGLVTHSANDVFDSSNTIASSNKEISSAIDDIGNGIEVQAQDSQDCLLQMDELSQKITNIYENITKIESVANESKEMINNAITSMEMLSKQSEATNEITKYVVNNVTELEEKSQAIGIIIQKIDEIADQTNLLSLNASIEAARAGEFGRGFAVVAAEIRKLADESRKSANDIKNMVQEINQHTNATVTTAKKAEDIVGKQEKIVNDTIGSFHNLNRGLEILIHNLSTIGQSMQNMEGARASTLNAMESISAVSEETLAASNTIYDTISGQEQTIHSLEKAADKLKDNAKELNTVINLFQI